MSGEKARLEAPTWMVWLLSHGGWLLLTWHYDALPWWLVLPLGAWLVAWQNSFQHEAVHGHPSGRPWLDTALAAWPLGLWMPFGCYRESHLRHHAVAELAKPGVDPESFYVTPEDWHRRGPLGRALLTVNQTLAGRLVLGPVLVALRFWQTEVQMLIAGDTRHLGAWALHVALAAPLLVWVVGVCDIPLAAYVALFAYSGLSLTLLRSFNEHRLAVEPAERTIINEGGVLTRLLFLNNNLHALHHAQPGLAWYELPQHYRRQREELLSENGGYWVSGYGAVARAYGLRPKERPVFPERLATGD